MKCMLIQTNLKTRDIVVSEGLYYSYGLPQESCDKVLVVGKAEGGRLPLLAACSKATVDRQLGRVHPAFGAAAIGSSWDYVWYLTVEKRFSGVYLPAGEELAGGIDLELGCSAVHFVYRELEGLEELGLTDGEGKAFNATQEALTLYMKKAGKGVKKTRSKKEEAALAAREAKKKELAEAARQCGPVPMIPAEMYAVGDSVRVEIGLGAARKSYQGQVVEVKERFAKNPMAPDEEMCIDQIVSVQVEGGKVSKFSALAMRKNEKKRG